MCRVWLQKVSLYNLCEWIGTPNPKKTAPGHRPVKNRNSEKPAVISCKRRSYRTEYGEGCEGGAGPKGPITLGVTAHRHFLQTFFFQGGIAPWNPSTSASPFPPLLLLEGS